MMQHKVFIPSLILILFSLLSLNAAQYAEFGTLDTLINNFNYDGGSTITFTEDFQVVGIAQNRTAVNWVAIGISTGDGNSFSPRAMLSGGNELEYQIYDSISSGNIILDRTAASAPSDLIIIDINEATKKFKINTSFELQINADQSAPNGTYSDTNLVFTLYGIVGLTAANSPASLTMTDINNMVVFDTVVVQLEVDVLKNLTMSIIDRNAAFSFTSAPYSMDFGTLDPSETLLADIIVEAHTPYSISVESTNGSRLKHLTVVEYVDYTFSFDSSLVSLTQGVSTALVTNAPASSSPGDRYPIDIQIQPVIGSVPAGDYADNLTFTITAN